MKISRPQEIALFTLVAFLSGIFGSYIFSKNVPTSAPTVENSEATQQTETIREVIPENAVTEVAEKYRDSVVSVIGEKELATVMRDPRSLFFNLNDPFFNQFFDTPETPDNSGGNQPEGKTEKKQIGAGTGFVISDDGMILTNKHVVADTEADYTVIFADGEKLAAEVIARDPTNDLAVLKIKEPGERKFNPVDFIADTEKVTIGPFAIAIGNALGQFDNTVTLGVISANGRSITAGDGRGSSENLSQLLQTDAAINPGNSGGPLVNLTGEVLGVNTAIAGGEGIGFAIPLDATRIEKMLGQIAEFGKIVKPFLGVRYQLITPDLNEELKLGSDSGAWLKGENDLPAVIADTPAAAAGLKGGDIVLEVDGTKVDSDNPLADILNKYSPKDEVEFTILRDGKEEKLKVVLGEWEEE
ncbi:trypsin-like peptidase domain-containing protein [Candidatus Gracilibacteria bacterium]|nr:trypsin-like peptidase domain-containing protein [Candidatus Gracilibacteria bacterium]